MRLFRVRGAVHNTAKRLLNAALTKSINRDAQFPYSDAAKPVKFTAESACVFNGLSRGQRAPITAVECVGQYSTSFAGAASFSYSVPIDIETLVPNASFGTKLDYYIVIVYIGRAGGLQDDSGDFTVSDDNGMWESLTAAAYFNGSFATAQIGCVYFYENSKTTTLRINWASSFGTTQVTPVIVSLRAYKNTITDYSAMSPPSPNGTVNAQAYDYYYQGFLDKFPVRYKEVKITSGFFASAPLEYDVLTATQRASLIAASRDSTVPVRWYLDAIELDYTHKYSFSTKALTGAVTTITLVPNILDTSLLTDTTYGEWKSISISAPSTASFDGEATDAGLADLITATGNFSVAFTSSDLLLNKELRVDTRTYDITSQPALISKAYVVRTDVRTYALAGQQALFRVDRLAITEVNGYTVSFKASAITAQRLNVAETEVYQLQGQDVEILLPNKVITATGSIVVNGTEAALLRGYAAQANTSSYAIDGQSIEMSQSRVVQTEDTQYDVNSTPAIVAKGLQYPVDSTDYSLVFTSSVLEFNRKVRAFGGGYTLTGNPVEFTVPKVVIAETSAYIVQGEAVLLAGSLLIADSANYVTGNTQAVVKAGREVLAVTRDYSVVGKNALIVKRASYTVVAEKAVYALTITAVTIKAPALLRTQKAVFNIATYVVALKVPAKIVVTATEYTTVGNEAILQYSGLALFNMEAEQAVYLVDTPNVGLNYVKYLVCATAKYKVNKADYTLVTNTQMSEAERLARRQMGNTIRLGG